MPFSNGISNIQMPNKSARTYLCSSLRTCNLEVANPEHFYADDIGNHSEMSSNIGDLTPWMYTKLLYG